MRICVVGNGDSPRGHGDFIDCHDVIIRVNGWWRTHPPPIAGRKITHWSWNTALYLVGLKEAGEKNKVVKQMPPESGDGRKYALCAENFRGGRKHIRNAKTALGKLGKRPLLFMDKNADSRLARKLKALSGRKQMPTTGMRALHRAVLMEPHHLTIIGFDATLPNRPGWNDRGNPWRKNWNCHDFVAEKKVIAELVDGKVWLGQPVNFSVDWVGRPELP